MGQRVLVCGGRTFSNLGLLIEVLDAAHAANPITCLIHGAAKGADQLAAKWAHDSGVACAAYPASWEFDGNSAGPIRNQRMIDQGKPDLVIAFPGGRGTADMVSRAEKASLPVHRAHLER